jgi:hypothetical protein
MMTNPSFQVLHAPQWQSEKHLQSGDRVWILTDVQSYQSSAGSQPHGTSRTVFFAGSWDHPFCRQKGPPAGEG